MIGINAFTKKMTVVPLMKKDSAHLTAGLLETLKKNRASNRKPFTQMKKEA